VALRAFQIPLDFTRPDRQFQAEVQFATGGVAGDVVADSSAMAAVLSSLDIVRLFAVALPVGVVPLAIAVALPTRFSSLVEGAAVGGCQFPALPCSAFDCGDETHSAIDWYGRRLRAIPPPPRSGTGIHARQAP